MNNTEQIDRTAAVPVDAEQVDLRGRPATFRGFAGALSVFRRSSPMLDGFLMKVLYLSLAAFASNLTGCMLIGAATMPDPKTDPVATVSKVDTRCSGIDYRYRISLRGKNYVFNIHGDPLGFLLFGRWYEIPTEHSIHVDALEGELRPGAVCIDGYVPRDGIGFVRFVGSNIDVDIVSRSSEEAGRDWTFKYRGSLEGPRPDKPAPNVEFDEPEDVRPEIDNQNDGGGSYCREFGMQYNKSSGTWEKCKSP